MNIKIIKRETSYCNQDIKKIAGDEHYSISYDNHTSKMIEVEGRITGFYNIDSRRQYDTSSWNFDKDTTDWRFCMEDIDEYIQIEKEIDIKEGQRILFQNADRSNYFFELKNGELRIIRQDLKSDYETIEYEGIFEIIDLTDKEECKKYKITCPQCNGIGKINYEVGMDECPLCEGTSIIYK